MNRDFYNPYSFVPLSNRVVRLNEQQVDELKYIQDVPIDGGYSGKIKIDFEALSAFLVKDGESNASGGNKFFVPGTSVKGMIRSIFEIITLSNPKNSIRDSRYSWRDVGHNDYELKTPKFAPLGGFLLKINGDYYVQECPKSEGGIKDFAYSYDEIADEEKVSGKALKDKKNIADKYAMLKESHRIPFKYDPKYEEMYMWVFSGKMQNKEHEFAFQLPIFSESRMIPLKGKELEDFIFIHEKENENENWKYWKKALKNYSSIDELQSDQYRGIVPCFFRKTDDGKAVKDLGFSYLYRLPFKKSIHQLLPGCCKEEGIDLTQALFGYVTKEDSLRGRVRFCNAFIDNAEQLNEQTFILGSPKPTFFPFYISQKDRGAKLNTYSTGSQISGVKRYLQQRTAINSTMEKSRVTSTFKPLKQGAKFTTYVYFHNLHDYELGALIASINFCGHSECCHSLGYAKPLGYGRMKVNGCQIVECDRDYDYDKLNSAFKSFVVADSEWTSIVNKVVQLSTVSTGKVIRYPNMNAKPKNEFVEIKNEKLTIADFSPIK